MQCIFFKSFGKQSFVAEKDQFSRKAVKLKRFKVSQYRMKTVAKLFYMPKFRYDREKCLAFSQKHPKTRRLFIFFFGFFFV